MTYLRQIRWYDWLLLAVVMSFVVDVLIRGD